MLIDTHSHLSFKAYENDRNEVVKRTQEQDVICIDVGTKYETSKKAVELAEKYDNIFSAVGMHPIYINPVRNSSLANEISNGVKTDLGFSPLGEDFNKDRYKKLITSSKKVAAIGEIGLDYYYKPKTKKKLEQFKEEQKRVFVKQLQLAEELDLPVILHCRFAHGDLINILKSYANRSGNYKLRGVVHCFTGTIKEMEEYLNLGFYVGFNGIIFKLALREAIKNCPLDKILVETDCPYLIPPLVVCQSNGNKVSRNEPIFIKYIIEEIAKIKDIRYEKISEITFQNAKKLFKLQI